MPALLLEAEWPKLVSPPACEDKLYPVLLVILASTAIIFAIMLALLRLSMPFETDACSAPCEGPDFPAASLAFGSFTLDFFASLDTGLGLHN
eukprot:8821888-Pyramimonas_sp.AAC.2